MQTLQQQFPLSPLKFWKKMIPSLIGNIFTSIFIGVSLGFILTIVSVGSGTSDLGYLLGSSIGFIIGFYVIVTGIQAWYYKTYIARYFYDANEHFITIRKGVFAPTEIHVQYAKIQDVYVDQDILDRIMGLYDVHIASATATSGIEAHIDGVEKAAADGLKELLLNRIKGGSMPAPMSDGMQAPKPSAPSPKFDGNVSSASYPIAGSWLVKQSVVWIFGSLFYSAILMFYVYSPGKNSQPSLATTLHLSFGSVFLTALALFLIIWIFHIIYFVLWRSTFSFAFLPDYIVLKKGIIAKTENHLPYRSVQDVAISQSIIDRMLGIATVRIENAAAAQMVGKRMVSSAVLLPGQPFQKANELSEVVKSITLTKDSSQTGL